MVRLIIAGPVYVEYEASPLEYQIEDYLREIGTALGPAIIKTHTDKSVKTYRASIRKSKGLSFILYKHMDDIKYGLISLSDLLKQLGDDEAVTDQTFVLQRKFGDEIGIVYSPKKDRKIEVLNGCRGKQLQLLYNKLNRVLKESKKPTIDEIYKTAIKSIPKLSK